LLEERVDNLLKKWDGQIKRNEEEYKKQASELLEEETFLFRAID
jgi:hypothetical protein